MTVQPRSPKRKRAALDSGRVISNVLVGAIVVGTISGALAFFDVFSNGHVQIATLIAFIFSTILLIALLPLYLRAKARSHSNS